MDMPALYEEDVYAWSQHQAQALRRLAATGLPLPNELDLEHVAEEIEDLGNEQRFQVESLVEQALAHLIKLLVLPESPARLHWQKEIRAFLLTASKRWRPSMRRAIDVEKLWSNACYQAGGDLADEGIQLPGLPDRMRFTLDELVSGRADPGALVAWLRQTMPTP